MGLERHGPPLLDGKPPKEAGPNAYKRWKSSCYRKIRYETAEEAEAGAPGMEPYQCDFCFKFHLTHPEGCPPKFNGVNPDFPVSTADFRYISKDGKTFTLRRPDLAKRSFNFFLNDPGTWKTEEFLEIVWKYAGFNCEEIRLADSSFRHPETGLISHRYDLYFRVGQGFLRGRHEVNDIMMKIELDIRANLNVSMNTTHLNRSRHAPATLYAVG